MNCHLLAAPLFRPNGIVEFVRAMIETQGGELFTDSAPLHQLQVPYRALRPVTSTYQPLMLHRDWGNGVEKSPWLHWDARLVEDMARVAERLPPEAVIYTHCAIAEAGAQKAGRSTIFVQHESAIYSPKPQLSYLSDYWLEQHRRLMLKTTVGLTMPPTACMQYRAAVATPYPIEHQQLTRTAHEGEVVTFFDGSYRKGWDRYLKWYEANGKPSTTVITKEADSRWPQAWRVRSFLPTETRAKLQCIRNHERAVIPSRSEVTGLALLECISQVPTVAFADPWTAPYQARITRLIE